MRRALLTRSANWILGRLLPEAQKDAVIGDLIEEHALRTATSHAPNDSWWYLGQVSRSLLPLLLAAARRGQWLPTFGAAVAAYGLIKIIESASEVTLFAVLAPQSLAYVLAAYLIGPANMMLGGYVAARIRPGAATVLAIISIIMVLQWMATAGSTVSIWFSAFFLVVCPLTALAGGVLERKQRNIRVQ